MSYELVPFAKGCRRDHYAVNKISRLVSMDGSQKNTAYLWERGLIPLLSANWPAFMFQVEEWAVSRRRISSLIMRILAMVEFRHQ